MNEIIKRFKEGIRITIISLSIFIISFIGLFIIKLKPNLIRVLLILINVVGIILCIFSLTKIDVKYIDEAYVKKSKILKTITIILLILFILYSFILFSIRYN